jgi:fibronectin type 3 domain-containing protein
MSSLGTNTFAGYYGDAGHHLIGWSARSLPTDLFQGVGTTIRAGAWGLSWEYVILLSNAANKDIWINIPVSATGGSDALDPTYVGSPDTSSYIYNLAYLLKNGDAFTGNQGLKPGLHIYIEHSNEVWNPGFSQYTWNLLAAEDEVSKGGSVLNNDGDTSQYDWADRRHLKRIYEISQIFESVFGPGSLNTTIRPVYAWWALDEGVGSGAANALAWFKKTYGPPSNYFYAMAQADYFAATNYANDTTIPEVLADMQASSNASVQYVTSGKATAAAYGLPLYAYEGGPDNSNGGSGSTTNIGVQILANRDPGMASLVQSHIANNWFAQGGGTFSYFNLSQGYTRYGSWGATDNYQNLATPKYEALETLTGYSPTGPPSAPTSLVASAGNNSAALTWQNVLGASSYNVLRGTASGGEGMTPIATVSSPTFQDNGLTNGTTYYYEVTAVNTFGQSGVSNEAFATPQAAAPAAPALSGAAGNGQAVLNWSAAAGAASYNVYEGTSSGGESSAPIATGITATTYTVTGLTNGTTYYFQVVGVNSVGAGAISNEVALKPLGAPAAPANLTARGENGQAVLSWSASAGASSYNVYSGTAPAAESATPIATDVASTTYTATGLTNGTAYYFTVVAVNAGGVSGASNEATAIPAATGVGGSVLLAYEPFGEPTGALGGAMGGGDFGWAAGWVEQSGSSAVPGYDVASATPLTYSGLLTAPDYGIGGYGYQTAGRELDVSANGAFSAYLSNGLIGAPGSTVWLSFLLRKDASANETVAVYTNTNSVPWYSTAPNNLGIGYFGTSSNDSNGNPYWSLQFNGTTVQSKAPVVVGQPALLVVGITFGMGGAGDQVSLYVDPTSLGGTAPATPTLQYSPAGSTAFQGIAFYGGDTTNQSSVGDIRLGSSYAAVTPMAASTAPAAPTGVIAIAGSGQVQLSWTASTGATSYQVWDSTGGNFGEAGSPVTGTSATITGLANGTAYTFYVTASNSIGTSGPSNFVSATPMQAVPPAPAGLAALAGNAQVVLNWTASVGASSYNVYQGTAAGAESITPVASGVTAATATVTGLTNGTAYFFKVVAVNSAGSSGYSNEASATPMATATGGGTLLAYEPFGETAGPLSGANGGGDFGWGAAWIEQFGSLAVPGYDVATTNPVTYTGLETSGNYGIGGYAYQSVGRQLDVSASGAFRSYLSNGLIGAPGTSIWISFLLREDANPANGEINAVYLNPSGDGNSWLTGGANTLGIGYFGSSSNDAKGNPYWSLNDGNTTVQTTVPVVQGASTLFVAQVTFGSGGGQNQVALFINPASLGGSAPTAASAQYATSSSLAFQSISYEGGYNVNESSLDEIRVGTSFAAVTPAAAVAPSAPTGLTAAAGSEQAVLNWTASSGAASYNVYQGSAAGAEATTPIATGLTGTSYTVTGLTNGATYFFTVAAVSAGGVSGYSNEASAAAVAAKQSITFNPLPGAVYGAMPFTLPATASSGLPVSFAVSGPATISGSTLTITGAGMVTVTASQAGNAYYAAAASVSQSFTVAKAVLQAAAASVSRAYAAANPALTYAVSGFVNGDTIAAVSGTATLTTAANATSLPGPYAITFATEALTAANYSFTYVPGTLTVAPETLTIAPSAGNFGSVAVGKTSPAISFTVTNNTASTMGYLGYTNLGEFYLQPGTCHLVNGEPMLKPGQSCAFTAVFKPAKPGAVSGNLSIQTSSGTFNVPMTGSGSALVISPAAGNFGSVAVGKTSAAISFTVTNDTPSTMGYLGYTNLGEFSPQPGTCHLVNGEPMLNPGQSCVFTAVFKPAKAGAVSGDLSINTSSGTFNVPMTGTGAAH